MSRRRAFLAFICCAFLLVVQLHVWSAPGCSMCGSACRCAGRVASSCAFRSVGCGGGEDARLLGAIAPLRAVIAPVTNVAPALASQPIPMTTAQPPRELVRPPLDHPPRISC